MPQTFPRPFDLFAKRGTEEATLNVDPSKAKKTSTKENDELVVELVRMRMYIFVVEQNAVVVFARRQS